MPYRWAASDRCPEDRAVDNGDQPGLGLRGLRRAERAADERTAWSFPVAGPGPAVGCGSHRSSGDGLVRSSSPAWRRSSRVRRASDRRTPSRRSNGATDSRRVGAAAVVLDWHDIRAAAAGRWPKWSSGRQVPRVGRPGGGKPRGGRNLGRRPTFSPKAKRRNPRGGRNLGRRPTFSPKATRRRDPDQPCGGCRLRHLSRSASADRFCVVAKTPRGRRAAGCRSTVRESIALLSRTAIPETVKMLSPHDRPPLQDGPSAATASGRLLVRRPSAACMPSWRSIGRPPMPSVPNTCSIRGQSRPEGRRYG